MVVLRDEVEELIQSEIRAYESGKSSYAGDNTLFDYSVDGHRISISMEATESGGAHMMPGLIQKVTWTLTNNCTTVKYVEDEERLGTNLAGRPYKRIDVDIDLDSATIEEVKNLRDHLS